MPIISEIKLVYHHLHCSVEDPGLISLREFFFLDFLFFFLTVFISVFEESNFSVLAIILSKILRIFKNN